VANVDDHGLEVIKKAGVNLDPTSKRNYALQIVDSKKFAIPADCDFISRSVLSNVETYIYKSGGSGGTTLKTVTLTYTNASLNSLVSVAVS
jgi:hypothetical protein